MFNKVLIAKRGELALQAKSSESYLNITSIIGSAEFTEVDAIHPRAMAFCQKMSILSVMYKN